MTIVTRNTYYFEDLDLGMEASTLRTVTDSDVAAFAEISGDKNPIHLDADFAEKSIFKGRIAHGLLTASYISTVFGMEMPGPGAIYVSQTLNFRAPVRLGDTVLTKVRVVELFPAKRRVRFECQCTIDGKPVLEGEAILLVPARPARKG